MYMIKLCGVSVLPMNRFYDTITLGIEYLAKALSHFDAKNTIK